MYGLGLAEIGMIVGLLLLIFGPKRLPQIGRSLGSAIREFKGAFREIGGGVTDAKKALKDEEREVRRLIDRAGDDGP